jgi:hypothetical protein
VLLASVVVSTLMVPIATAGAAAGTVCKTETGSSVFSPTLPAKPDKVVNTVQHTRGTLSSCNDGVTGATTQHGGTFHGTVTAGRFAGTQVSYSLVWLEFGPPGACATAGLKTITFKSTAAVHI